MQPEQSGNAAFVPRPRLLDLFCGGGGASMGYWLAGFEVIGVDIAKRGHTVEVQLRANANGRSISFYRCVLDEPSASLDDVRDVTGSTVGSSSTSPNPVLTEDPPSPSKPRAFNRDGGMLLLFDEHDQARLWEPDAA